MGTKLPDTMAVSGKKKHLPPCYRIVFHCLAWVKNKSILLTQSFNFVLAQTCNLANFVCFVAE